MITWTIHPTVYHHAWYDNTVDIFAICGHVDVVTNNFNPLFKKIGPLDVTFGGAVFLSFSSVSTLNMAITLPFYGAKNGLDINHLRGTMYVSYLASGSPSIRG